MSKPIKSDYHYSDLKKRYQSVDYVTQYITHWAKFNAWFMTETGSRTDRGSIEALKQHPKIITVIDDLCTLPEDKFLKNLDRYDIDYIKYRMSNHITGFIEHCFRNRTYTKSLNLFNQNKNTRTKPTYTIFFPIKDYRLVHHHRASMEASSIGIIEDYSMNELFLDAGIKNIGNVLAKTEKLHINPNKKAGAEMFWRHANNDIKLEKIKMLYSSNKKDSICEDIIEMLYLARNLCVHGTFDFLTQQHNNIAKSALNVLDEIVKGLTSKI